MPKKQRGALLLEFVLILPFFLWLTFLALYYAMVAHDISALHDAVRAGSRYGAVTLVDENNTDAKKATAKDTIKKYANSMLYLYDVQDENITVETGDSIKIDEELGVKVTVTAPLKNASGVPALVRDVVPESISSTLTMRLEQ